MSKLLEFVHVGSHSDTLWDVMWNKLSTVKLGIVFLDNFQLYFEAADDCQPRYPDYILREILDFIEPRQKQIDKDLEKLMSSTDTQHIDPYDNK